MRDQDRDLIMALAEGTLQGPEAVALEAGLDEESRAELAAQRFALHMLAAAPDPVLSDLERERLHMRVLAGGPAAAVPSRERRAYRRWMPAWAGAAAAVVAIVAVSAVIGKGPFDNGGDDTVGGFASGAELTTTTAAAARDRAPAEADGLSSVPATGESAEPGVGAVSSTTLAGLEAATPDPGMDLSGEDLAGLRSGMKSYEGPIAYDPQTQPCYDRMMADDGRRVVLAFPATWSGQDAVMFFLSGADEAGPPLRVYSVEGCELVASSGE